MRKKENRTWLVVDIVRTRNFAASGSAICARRAPRSFTATAVIVAAVTACVTTAVTAAELVRGHGSSATTAPTTSKVVKAE